MDSHISTARSGITLICLALAVGIAVLTAALGRAEPLPAPPPPLLNQLSPPPAPESQQSPGLPSRRLEAYPMPPEMLGVDLSRQTEVEAAAKSRNCVGCHQNVQDMHNRPTVRLGCVDCHGGNPCGVTKESAHVPPRFPDAWPTSANPVRSYTLLNYESPEFVRFVNPGDLRIAHISCGQCHAHEVLAVRKSMMTHGAMLWEAALYNNGSVPSKFARYGESYSMTGVPQRIQTVPPPTEEEILQKGVLCYLDPLPRFEITQPSNVLRIFERGGRFQAETGVPETLEESGKPRQKLSTRGLGTENRTDPVFISLQKTRLLDPTLNFLGTNDHPGDYRSSGCTACHVVYANDRSPVHSGPYAKYGNLGMAFNPDPMIPSGEPGHPITHMFARGGGVPTSQCMVCHVHPGTSVLNSYIGYQWWDEETDGELMYPARQKHLTDAESLASQVSNPDETAARGLWSDPEFLANLTDLNRSTRYTQFADFHGHGWVFRAVFKKDRQGNLLDHRGRVVDPATNEKLRAAIDITADMKEPYRDAERKTPEQIRQEEAALAHRRDGLPVHLLDIHMEKGMHCVDCHFEQDVHGNTRLQREVRAAVEIQCIDCHGTATQHATLRTSGPASYTSSPQGGRDLSLLFTPSGRRRFEREGDKLYQNSMVEENLRWEVVQTADTVDPASEHYNARSAMAKTVRFNAEGRLEWGGRPEPGQCAHKNERMSCIACHSSWNPSCYGCHLPQRANRRLPDLHNEGDVTRNYVAYDLQTLRDDVYMLAHDGDVTGNRIGPARSSCAIHVSSFNANREEIYVQQQTISADGMAGISFSTNVPHTVRGGIGAGGWGLGDGGRQAASGAVAAGGPLAASQRGPVVRVASVNEPIGGRPRDPERIDAEPACRPGIYETKMCTDCHVARENNNNAIMAQLLMQGTNYVNFIGQYCWVAAGEQGLAAVQVTEREEPQAVIGSTLQSIAFPDDFAAHVDHGRILKTAFKHPGHDVSQPLFHPLEKSEILALQHRGEYLYAACGAGGLRVFDIAFIADKGFSQRFTTAPVSPLGQQFFVPTKYATAIAAPTTIAPDPTRKQSPENREQAIHAMYGYIFVVDRYEGLITVPAGTLLDGNPLNNFLHRETTFNPDGVLCGARAISIVGTYAYICCDAGLVVVWLDDPKCPRVTAVLGRDLLQNPVAFAAQFRYGMVCDCEGIKVLDITDLAHPRPVAMLPLAEAHSIYLARTYAYVAAGSQGLVIVDITNPERPRVDQVYNAGGCINDARDVKLGITYTSEFAYLADGCNGLRVVQLTSPDTPGNQGFSPRPTPQLVATWPVPHGGQALAILKGLDRDRAVDESGNQIAVFGRIGARPLNLEDQQRMYLRDGQLWRVSDDPFSDIYIHPPQAEPLPLPGTR